ncbi:MAG: hypothetical protein V1914_03910 [archaeon]
MKLLKNKIFLAHGKRSVVYLAKLGSKKVVVKEKRAGSEAINRMENEAYWLERLNKVGIGPKIYSYGIDFVVIDYVPGLRILDWIPRHGEKKIKVVLLDVLKQCRKLDGLKVNKEEMHNPYKHIIVKGKKVTLIDFERCRNVRSPQNVTQFCQFLMSRKLSLMLERKGISFKDMIKVLKDYKKNASEKNFERIRESLGL